MNNVESMSSNDVLEKMVGIVDINTVNNQTVDEKLHLQADGQTHADVDVVANGTSSS